MIRVMITSVTRPASPTIVWGFDDASFLYRVQAATLDGRGNTTLTLANAPVDSYHYPPPARRWSCSATRSAHRDRLHRRRRRLRRGAGVATLPTTRPACSPWRSRASCRRTPFAPRPGSSTCGSGRRRYGRARRAKPPRSATHRRRGHAHLEHRHLPPRRLLAFRPPADPARDRLPGPHLGASAAARRPADLGLPARRPDAGTRGARWCPPASRPSRASPN